MRGTTKEIGIAKAVKQELGVSKSKVELRQEKRIGCEERVELAGK